MKTYIVIVAALAFVASLTAADATPSAGEQIRSPGQGQRLAGYCTQTCTYNPITRSTYCTQHCF